MTHSGMERVELHEDVTCIAVQQSITEALFYGFHPQVHLQI